MMDLDGAPYGGARYPVESTMGGRTFGELLFPPDHGHVGHCDTGESKPVPHPGMLHAYTLPRTTPNSRVPDLVNMVLLIRSGTLEQSRVVQALNTTFCRRATHSFTAALTPPPKGCRSAF